ncbi:peptidoglycan-binding domain-containing protein [Chondrinema litorale]|uniref:peptidoglycan-binding domain-containing protein n=1 Tax=Chondrinema litorale TaxID=2994555 RepID=UPI0025428DD1|nr:peptidoglycan-binding domain-containing protein [Chondrinema litorale]UZR95445.1 peptidoglycan-binding domain-containing protein [Chondrinema litorale]
MKKLAYLIIILALPILVFFQYQSYTRFNPPFNLSFSPTDSLDMAYHNPLVVEEYHNLLYQIPAFARSKWANEGIDVRFPDEGDEDSIEAATYYDNMLTSLKLLESKLKSAYLLKQQGFDNAAINEMELKGISPQTYKMQSATYMIGSKKGEKNSAVWELQKHLLKKGYDIPKDGIFDIETENALKDLQSKNDLYPSGIVEESVLPFLIIN